MQDTEKSSVVLSQARSAVWPDGSGLCSFQSLFGPECILGSYNGLGAGPRKAEGMEQGSCDFASEIMKYYVIVSCLMLRG